MEKVSIKGLEISFNVKVDEAILDGLSETNLINIRQDIVGIRMSLESLEDALNNLNRKE